MVKFEDITLWDHQKEAIKKADEYINSVNEKSFLLKLPTGAGKTGVIATLSRVLYPTKNFLIVVPSIALKEQLLNELKEKFWEKVSIDCSELPQKEILSFTPSEFDSIKIKINGKPFILICVVNTIHSLKNTSEDNYKFLQNNIDYIVFDEGHKEPAFSWALAVRGLKKKMLLFTTTPFRNDLKFFNADKENFYFFPHIDALNNNVIRDVEFKQFDNTGNITKTVAEIINLVNFEITKFKREKEPLSPKTIIRCDDEDTIKIIVNELKRQGKKAAGIHEELDGKDNLYREVPTRKELDEFDFIVHQFKLTEGIDYPNFLILFVFDDYKNDRSLVQQVGRITRNISLLPSPKSVVYCTNKTKYNAIWDSYKRYDNNVVEYKRLYDLSDFYLVNEKIRWIYFNGEFRAVSNKDSIDESKIKVPSRVSIKNNPSSLTFNQLKNKVEDDISKFDILPFKNIDLPNNGHIILYEIFNNSAYLTEEIFIENKFGFLLFYLIDEKVYYFSTDNRLPKCLEDLPNIDYKVLLNALNKSKRLTRINLINSDIGRNSVRSYNLSSYSLEKTAIGLTDHSQVATLTEGFINNGSEKTRRYVGLSKSKVSDYNSDYLTIGGYYTWIRELHNILKTKSFKSTYLQRFAQAITSPPTTEPAHILIDVDDDFLKDYKVEGKFKFEVQDFSQEIIGNSFQLEIECNKRRTLFTCQIVYDSKTRKYKIKSNELAKAIFNPISKESIITFLNRNQPLRIVTKNNNAFYAFGNFYSPRLDLLNRKNDLNVLDVFYSIPELEKITSEKGDNKRLKPLTKTWHKETLFGLVARKGIGYTTKELKDHFNFDYLVCDDLNKENADFIGINNLNGIKRITLIHAKAGSSRLSASAFQEVCGQAVKNLDLLSPFYEKAPISNFKKWDGEWKNRKIGKVKSRILHGNKNGKEIWDIYQELLVHPETKKEVFILTGALFCKSDFKKELDKKKIESVKPEVIQLVYLIRSTWSSVSSVGASLKIFCY